MDEELPGMGEPDVVEDESEGRTGTGTRISEITGPTRDLFIDLLSPLARLDSLTSIGNRIYDLLDERLNGRSGVHIERMEITTFGDFDATIDEIEEALRDRQVFAVRGNA